MSLISEEKKKSIKNKTTKKKEQMCRFLICDDIITWG